MARCEIFWSGGTPSIEAISLCEKRDHVMRVIDGEITDVALARAKGVILRWPQEIGSAVVAALSHGATPVVLCDFPDIPDVGRTIESLGVKDAKSFVFIECDAEDAVRRVSRGPDTPSWNPNVGVDGGEKLGPEEKLLLSRAFGDCDRVHLHPELGGSANVYQAYARLSDSRAGPVAMPFFVKFGQRAYIERELLNYRECTTLHVPFNQRPNVDWARCALGFRYGIIVGNFVERSESLQSVTDRGAALAPLQSLFNSALRGWRQQADIEGAASVRQAVLAREMRLCLPWSYKQQRRDRLDRHVIIAHKEFGATMTFTELEHRLCALPAIQFRYAIAHNDLHGENVRVTGQDAILIDFASTDHGPLTADPAALDVSLVLSTRAVEGSAWESLAKQLYRLDALTRPPRPLPPETQGAQISDAVRFLRQIALTDTIDVLEYPIAVALQLLRKASYGRQPRRGALAYALAETLTTEITSTFESRKFRTDP